MQSNSSHKFSFALKPSTIPEAGIGVFALDTITKWEALGLFLDDFDAAPVRVEEVPEDLQGYCINKGDGTLICPKDFNQMNIGNYINHSASPNVSYVKGRGYFAARDVNPGEELLADYGNIGDQYDVPKDVREPYV